MADELKVRLAACGEQMSTMDEIINDLGREKEQYKARLAEAENVIESAGKCLVMSNNGPREALEILRRYKYERAADSAPAVDAECVSLRDIENLSGGCYRPCTCHPDDNPPRPCPQKYALSECRAASAEEGAK